jgi:O-antigen/teichoic acid export membrane protein
MALVGWFLAPVLTDRVIAHVPALRTDCLWSLRIASLLVVLRAVETVCISTHRAFERYGDAIRISVLGRLLGLAAAGLLPRMTHSVTSVLTVTAGLLLLSVWLQLIRLCALINVPRLTPSFDRTTAGALLGFGLFTWIQAVSGLLFGQVDRIITGAALGAAAVTSYALCVQLSQPIYGIAAAGLHFLFPRLAIQHSLNNAAGLCRTVFLGFCINLIIVVIGTSTLLLAGETILRLWAGEDIARAGHSLLPLIVWSTALPALNVSGSYSLLALGQVRIVTWLNLIAGSTMLLSIPLLLPRYGLPGMAYARMFYGPITLAAYLPLSQFLFRVWTTSRTPSDCIPAVFERER